MKNRWLLNLVLALLVGMLVLVAIYKPGTRKEPEGTPLLTLAPEAIDRIRIVRAGQREIRLEKQARGWRLTAPRLTRANGYRVGDFISLAGARVGTHFAAGDDLGQYGLERPLATVFLNDIEIRFGGLHPLSSHVYVQHDNEVKLLPSAMLRAATVPLADLFDASPLGENAKIVGLRLPTFSLKQNDTGGWARTPELKDLGSDQVNRFVDEWRLARALSVAEAAGKTGRERVTATVHDGDTRRDIEFLVVTRKPELVLRRRDEGLDYHFPPETAERLLELKPDKPPVGGPAPQSDKTPAR